jgi:flavin reductase (DIM6/NTAB) family NADH-FMN oxidoreductase RutF
MTHLGQVEQQASTNFRGVMRRFPATVSIITANDGTRDHGMTVTALSSVSMDPPSLMVCLNNRTLLHEMLLEQSHFAVNVLDVTQFAFSDACSGAVLSEDRFAGDKWTRDEKGMLVLKAAHSNIICRRKVAVPFGTHTMFVGEVVRATVDETTTPLLYAEASYCRSHPL